MRYLLNKINFETIFFIVIPVVCVCVLIHAHLTGLTDLVLAFNDIVTFILNK